MPALLRPRSSAAPVGDQDATAPTAPIPTAPIPTETVPSDFTVPDARPAAGERHHGHRQVSGGWMRAGVFGAMDGLITNASLIAGVAGGVGGEGVDRHSFLLVGGLAGLVAGACSMAAGEWTSVRTQNALVRRELDSERRELVRRPEAEQAELADMLMRHGLTEGTARAAASEIAADPEVALRFHAREELGVDPDALATPTGAAVASFLSFAVGALIPLLPILFGIAALWPALVLAAVAAATGGAVVSRLTDRRPVRGAALQFGMVAAATAITYGLGVLIGSTVA